MPSKELEAQEGGLSWRYEVQGCYHTDGRKARGPKELSEVGPGLSPRAPSHIQNSCQGKRTSREAGRKPGRQGFLKVTSGVQHPSERLLSV